MPSPVVNLSQENMDISSDNENSGVQSNLFGGMVFDDPSFSARKPTPVEQDRDLQWDEEERANNREAIAKAEQIRAKMLDCLACLKKIPVPEDHSTMDGEVLSKEGSCASPIERQSNRRKQEQKQRWEESVGAATPAALPPVVAAPLVITPAPLPLVEEAPATPAHFLPVQVPSTITPKVFQLSYAFALVRQHDLLIVTAGSDSLSALSLEGASLAQAVSGLPSALKSLLYPTVPHRDVPQNDADDEALHNKFNGIGTVEPGSPRYDWFLQ
jgi:hypothetical protein